MDAKIKTQGYGFAIYPSIPLYGYKKVKSTGKFKFGFVKELLYGDYVKPFFKDNGDYETRKVDGKTYYKVRARNKTGYILNNKIQPNRVLEVNFIDVGQGDGCHVVTPKDEHLIIDAGKGDNMFRFLSWRFNLRKAKSAPPPFTTIISHSDQDHYGGFGKIFKHNYSFSQEFTINEVMHNGLVEGSGESVETLGTKVSHLGKDYITDLCDTEADFQVRKGAVNKKGNYIKLLEKTTAPKKSVRFGSPPIIDDGTIKLEVLGPAAIKVNGQDALPVFKSNKGKTKNGHSIILKLTIGHLKILLGGDLNSYAEDYLFERFTNTSVKSLVEKINDPKTTQADRQAAQTQLNQAITSMRDDFQVDIAKSCHHGSADFTSEFMEALHPIVTVISSGDEESYSHPRPDTLGTIGKHSRGKRSLIFCTELARSGKEYIDLTKLSGTKKKERVVTVYGMINVRSDGEKTIIAQKLESPGSSKNWDIHELKWNPQLNEFEYLIAD